MIINTPIGKLGVFFKNNQLVKIDFIEDESSSANAEVAHPVCTEIENYFTNPHHQFNIDFNLKGTEFQQRVWNEINKIPAGQVVTYSALAKQLKSSPRAIGNACRANPIPIVIPCHRVVAKNHLGGYAGNIKGKFFAIKEWLLQHEGVNT